jgi:hypothetical protein
MRGAEPLAGMSRGGAIIGRFLGVLTVRVPDHA